MDKILKFLYIKPVTTAMIFILILVLGVMAFLKIPLELNPKIELPTVYISTPWPGTSAETMESLITTQVEAAAVSIRGVKKISSRSSVGSSWVTVEFDDKAEYKFALLELSEKINNLADQLPPGVVPMLMKSAPKEMEPERLMSYSVTALWDESTIRKVITDKVKPLLLSIPGISDVNVIGGLDRRISILLDENKLDKFGLSYSTVQSRLGQLDFFKNCGELKSNNTALPIVIDQKSITIRDIESIPIAVIGGSVIKLKDIADISNSMSERNVYNRINGEPRIMIEIIKEPGGSIINIADEVSRQIELFHEKLPQLTFRLEYDQSEKLRLELSKLSEQSLISILGVFLALLIFVKRLKAPFLILSSIIFSVLTVIFAFSLLDISLNTLTLSGLALGIGMLVDNSIVIYDNCLYHLASGGSKLDKVGYAVKEVTVPLMGSTLTTMAVFIPFFFLPPGLKEIFYNFGIGMLFSILISFIFSLTFIPFAVLKFDSGGKVRDGIREFVFIRIHKKLLPFFIKRRTIVVVITIWLLGIPIWLLPSKIETEPFDRVYNTIFSSEFYTEYKDIIEKIFGGVWYLFNTKVRLNDVSQFRGDNSLRIDLQTEDGTNIEVLNGIVLKVEKFLESHKDYVKKITATVNGNSSTIFIDFKEEFENSYLPYKLKSDLICYFAEFGGLHASISGYGDSFSAGLPFYVKHDNWLTLFGYQYQQLKELANQLKERLEENPRVQDVDIEQAAFSDASGYEIVVRLNRSLLAQNGITVEEILNKIRAHTGGRSFYKSVKMDHEKIDIDLKFSDYKEYEMYDLLNQKFRDAAGNYHYLKDLLEIKREKTLTSITREDQQYSRVIAFNYLGPPFVARDYILSIVNTFRLPYGFRIETGYQYIWTQQNKIAMFQILAASILVIFLVTASVFESLKKPFIVLSALPMALIGVFTIYYITENNFGTGSYAGLVLLFGICVNNSIILVDHISSLIKSGLSIDSAIIEGTARRVRPIIMTTFTTIVGLLPFIIISEESSIWFGIALTVIGGMVSSTIIVLLVLPSVYRIFYSK